MARSFESLINWRMATSAFRNLRMRISASFNREQPDFEPESVVFVPRSRDVNVIDFRDWLHDPENISGSYTMIGCWETKQRSPEFTGFKLGFSEPTDAVYFRLCWANELATAQTAENPTAK